MKIYCFFSVLYHGKINIFDIWWRHLGLQEWDGTHQKNNGWILLIWSDYKEEKTHFYRLVEQQEIHVDFITVIMAQFH